MKDSCHGCKRKSYYFITDKFYDWYGGRRACEKKGMRLARIGDAYENELFHLAAAQYIGELSFHSFLPIIAINTTTPSN